MWVRAPPTLDFSRGVHLSERGPRETLQRSGVADDGQVVLDCPARERRAMVDAPTVHS